jgi:hypothetical protein
MTALPATKVMVSNHLCDEFTAWFEEHFQDGEMLDGNQHMIARITDPALRVLFKLRWCSLPGFRPYFEDGFLFDLPGSAELVELATWWQGNGITDIAEIVSVFAVGLPSPERREEFFDQFEEWEKLVTEDWA